MKKMVYKLVYKDFIGRECVREYRETCIVYVIDDAKKFMFVNNIKVARVVTPSGKEYYV